MAKWRNIKKYKSGGEVLTQWDLPSAPSTPGYQDYGTMYTVPGHYGLLPKNTQDNSWEGFGNSNNLLQPGTWGGGSYNAPTTQQPTQQLAMDPSDYSIDNIRSQYMKNGGPIQQTDGMVSSPVRQGAYFDGTSIRKATGTGSYNSQNGVYFKTGGLYKMGGDYTAMYGKGGIHIKESKKGTFTAAAKKRGMGVQEFANKVIANPGNYSEAMRKKAQFAHNAAGWKKQYGGMQYDNGGVIDPNGGLALPSSGNAWGSSAANTQQQMQDVYAPVAQANAAAPQIDPVSYANRPMVTEERANMNEQPVNATGFNNPYAAVPGDNVVQPPVMPKQPFGTGYRNLLGTAMIATNIAANARQNKNLRAYGIQQGMTRTDNPTSTSRGQYNQQGQLMPQFQPPARYGRYGGMMPTQQYAMGGIYQVPNSEIARLKSMGYEIEEID
jgi:hypothetical protein